MIKEFNKKTIVEVKDIFEKYMKQLEKETGIKISLERISFNSYSFSSKIKAEIPSTDGISNDQKRWEFVAFMYGFKKDDYGKSFTANGRTFTLYKLDGSRKKYPVICKCGTKQFKFKVSDVLQCLGR